MLVVDGLRGGEGRGGGGGEKNFIFCLLKINDLKKSEAGESMKALLMAHTCLYSDE